MPTLGPKYPLLIVKGDKKGEKIEKLFLEAVWKEQTFKYHKKNTQEKVGYKV